MLLLQLWLALLLTFPTVSCDGIAKYILGGIAGDDGNYPHPESQQPELAADPAACMKIVTNSTGS